MEAENYFGAWRTFDSKALGANGNAAVEADLERSAHAPNIGPPGAARGWTQNGALFFFGEFPGSLRGHAQFAVGFMGVAMESQRVNVGVGGLDLGEVFAGKIGWQSALPELVLTLDFSCGLRCWSIKEAAVIELES